MLCSYQPKYCLRESLLDTLSCQNDPTEVTAHFQKPSKGAVTVHACVFRYICLMANINDFLPLPHSVVPEGGNSPSPDAFKEHCVRHSHIPEL